MTNGRTSIMTDEIMTNFVVLPLSIHRKSTPLYAMNGIYRTRKYKGENSALSNFTRIERIMRNVRL